MNQEVVDQEDQTHPPAVIGEDRKGSFSDYFQEDSDGDGSGDKSRDNADYEGEG